MNPFANNPVCTLLGISTPFLEGGMAWVGTPFLAAAISNAGGLGTLGAGGLAPKELEQHVQQLRARTTRPFAVNLMLLNPQVEEQLEVCLQEQVPVIIFGAGNPGKLLERCHQRGIITLAVVASENLGLRLEQQGIHALIGEGMECGGHVGKVTTMTLIPALVDKVRVPVIAAGGIADARGILAAFCLGASGVQMGTRWIATAECEAHPHYKQRIVQAGIRDAVLTGEKLGHPARVLKNAYTRKILALEQSDPEQAERLLMGSLRKAFQQGDVQQGLFMAGQCAGLIHAVQPVSELIAEWMHSLPRLVESLPFRGNTKQGGE